MANSPRPRVAARAVIAMLRGYQRWISPALRPSCRFYPSCSAYAVESLRVHGLIRGVLMSIWRLLRCGPWHPGGIDLVPPARGQHDRRSSTIEEQAPC